MPQSLFYATSIQDALASAKKAATDMATVLATSNLHREQDSAIRPLYLKAVSLGRFTPPAVRIVGLVGGAGVGKSSLINSLLDIPGLARAVSQMPAFFMGFDLIIKRAVKVQHARVL